MAAKTRENFVYLAKLAQSAERFDEMLHYMNSVIEISGGELDVEERALVKIAYNNVVGSRKAISQVLKAAEDKEEESNKALVRDYVGIVESELGEICGKLIKLFEQGSIPAALESTEFYIQLKEVCGSNWPQFKGWTVLPDNMSTQQLFLLAKLGKSVQRYGDVLDYMYFLVKNSGAGITPEEEEILTSAYTEEIHPLKAVQEKLHDMLLKIEEAGKKQLMEEYMDKVEDVMLSVYSKMTDILKCIISIPVNDSTKMKKLGKDYPRFTNQGPLLGWFLSSRIYKRSVIKSLISYKMLYRTPLKEFRDFLEAGVNNLQVRARGELQDAFNDNFSLFSSVLSQLKVLYHKLLITQRKIKLKKRSLLYRRSMKHIFFTSTGKTWFKTKEEKKCEKFQVLIDCIVDGTEQLILHGSMGIIRKCRGIIVKNTSDIPLAGVYRKSGHFTGLLRINGKFKPEIIYSMITQALECGFPLKTIKIMQ